MKAELLYSGRYQGSRNTSLHRHDGMEIVFVSAGRCSNIVEGGAWNADAGNLFVIPPGLAHRQIDFGEVGTTYLVFELEPTAPFDPSFRVIETMRDPFVATWIDQIDLLYRQKEMEECNLLLSLLLRRLQRKELAGNASPGLPEPVAVALQHLAGHFAEPVSVPDLAKRCALSASYFNAIFHQHTGHSPMEHVRRLRMAYARRLLIGSRLPVAEVGEQCGIPNPNYFIRLFRQHHGCTPGDYRAGAGAHATPAE